MSDKAKGGEKQTLVEDLDEIEIDDGENEQDEFEANMKHFEEGGAKPAGTRTSFGKKDEDEDDDEVNVEEEHEETGGKETDKPKISVTVASMVNKPSKMAREQAEETKIENYDFSILDELFSTLDSPEESVEAILFGYFNKIVQALLGKIKSKMLHYILLQRKGDIFNRLLANL